MNAFLVCKVPRQASITVLHWISFFYYLVPWEQTAAVILNICLSFLANSISEECFELCSRIGTIAGTISCSGFNVSTLTFTHSSLQPLVGRTVLDITITPRECCLFNSHFYILKNLLIPVISGWYPQYVKKYKLEKNWKSSRCRTRKILPESSPLIFRFDPNQRMYLWLHFPLLLFSTRVILTSRSAFL